jgi:phosphate acetyltransferase
MAQSLMVLTADASIGKSVISLGLADQFERHGARTSYFKPVGTSVTGDLDSDVLFVHKVMSSKLRPQDLVAVSTADVCRAIAAHHYDEVLDRILEAHNRLAQTCDVIICEGVDSLRNFPSLESDFNLDIARNIDASILLIANGHKLGVEEVVSSISLTNSQLVEKGAQVCGVIINRVDEKLRGDFAEEARRQLRAEGIPLYGVLPHLNVLSSPRIRDVVRTLKAEMLVGDEQLATRVGKVLVAAMGLENALHYFEDGSLLITPGDREEILLAAAAAYGCDHCPRPAGVVLTGGFEPRRKVMQLVRSLSKGKLPIMRVSQNTYETAIAVNAIQPVLDAEQEDKALAIRAAMEEFIDVDRLVEQRFETTKRVVSPQRFMRSIRDMAKGQKKKIVLPEANVDRILKATEALRRQDIVDVVLIGDELEIRKYAKQLDVTLDEHVEIVNPKTDPRFELYVQTLLDARKHKAMHEDVARDLMADRNYFGTMMVHLGHADGMVSGSTTTTQATLRPAFEFVRTRPGIQHVSSIFFMCLPDKVLVYGDCAVIPNPTAEQLADIAVASAETAAAFGIEPRVAMLSYSTGDSGKGADVDLVREATQLVLSRHPDMMIEGPIQYDAAIDPDVARTKLPNSKVAGRATVFIFPDLNTGNNTYKAVQRSAGAIAIGPVLQGLRKPVNDLSRGATITDIVNTVIVTAIQATTNPD